MNHRDRLFTQLLRERARGLAAKARGPNVEPEKFLAYSFAADCFETTAQGIEAGLIDEYAASLLLHSAEGEG